MFDWLFKKPAPAPNDEPLVRVHLNPLLMVLEAREEQKGAPLTEAEVLEIRDNAQFVMLPASQAQKFYAALDAQIDVPRIDPDRVWEEWQALRPGRARAGEYAAAIEAAISKDRVRPGRLIDYAHRVGDGLYHGTLSDLDGSPKASWTFEVQGQPATREQPLTATTLNRLWHALAGAQVFRRSLAEAADREIDPDACHVIGAVEIHADGRREVRIFLPPANEQDADLAAWLTALERPK